MSKPREFAHLFKNRFGSADNINQLSSEYVYCFLTVGRKTIIVGGLNYSYNHHLSNYIQIITTVVFMHRKW